MRNRSWDALGRQGSEPPGPEPAFYQAQRDEASESESEGSGDKEQSVQKKASETRSHTDGDGDEENEESEAEDGSDDDSVDDDMAEALENYYTKADADKIVKEHSEALKREYR